MFAKLLLFVFAGAVALAPVGVNHLWPGKVAVVSSGHLMLMSSGGSRIVNGPGTPSEPIWSPDGTWVAFRREGTALWAAKADGTEAHRVSPAGLSVWEFSWVPNGAGEMLAFSAGPASARASTVYVASASSKTVRDLGSYPNLLGFSVAPSSIGKLAAGRA